MAQITIPLDIPDVRVVRTEINKHREVIITIESTKNYAICRKCEQMITKSHGQADWVKVRHLPVLGHATYLRYRPKRYQCQACDGKPTTTQQLEWRDTNSSHSKAYDEYLLFQLVNTTIEDVSIKEDFNNHLKQHEEEELYFERMMKCLND